MPSSTSSLWFDVFFRIWLVVFLRYYKRRVFLGFWRSELLIKRRQRFFDIVYEYLPHLELWNQRFLGRELKVIVIFVQVLDVLDFAYERGPKQTPSLSTLKLVVDNKKQVIGLAKLQLLNQEIIVGSETLHNLETEVFDQVLSLDFFLFLFILFPLRNQDTLFNLLDVFLEIRFFLFLFLFVVAALNVLEEFMQSLIQLLCFGLV